MLSDGEFGLFFTKEPGNLATLINYIEVHQPLITDLKKKSRQQIIEKYTWEKITDQYIQLFKSM